MKYARVRDLRIKAGLTQANVGEILGVSTRAYTHYEVGDRDMSPETLIALADYYGVTVDYLLGRTDDPGKPEK